MTDLKFKIIDSEAISTWFTIQIARNSYWRVCILHIHCLVIFIAIKNVFRIICSKILKALSSSLRVLWMSVRAFQVIDSSSFAPFISLAANLPSKCSFKPLAIELDEEEHNEPLSWFCGSVGLRRIGVLAWLQYSLTGFIFMQTLLPLSTRP